MRENCGIIGTLSEVFHELSVSNTWPLSEWEPKAKHEVSGHGIMSSDIVPAPVRVRPKGRTISEANRVHPPEGACPEDMVQ